MNDNFIKPKYDSGGFAGIPNRIKDAFASQKYDAVVLLFVDAFGWRFYERFQDAPFIKRMEKQGRIEKLTSQFPSTTAAHVTTLHTGLPVGMTGVHEWYYYEPKVDRIIAPLLFSFAGTERDSLKTRKVNAAEIYPKGIFYPELKTVFETSLHRFEELHGWDMVQNYESYLKYFGLEDQNKRNAPRIEAASF